MQTHKSARTAWPLFKTHGYFQLAKFKKLFLKFEITFFSKNHSESVCDCWRNRFFKKPSIWDLQGTSVGKHQVGWVNRVLNQSKVCLNRPIGKIICNSKWIIRPQVKCASLQELTYPTLGKGKSSSQVASGDSFSSDDHSPKTNGSVHTSPPIISKLKPSKTRLFLP